MRPQILHHIPAGVTFEKAALTEPICVAHIALVEKTPIKPGAAVVIQGPGMIGLMALFEAMRTTHRRLYEVHAGKTPPYAVKSRAQ